MIVLNLAVRVNDCEYLGNQKESFATKADAQKYAAGKLLEILEEREMKKQKTVHHERVFQTTEDYRIPINVSSIRAGVLTGHGSNDDWNFLTMDVQTQQEV